MAEKHKFKFLPISLRLETVGEIASPLVLRGTPLPTKRIDSFSTASDDQNSVEIKLLMGESSLAKNCVTLGTFHLVGIPPAPRGKPEITITFDVSQNCSVRVTAAVGGTDIHVESSFEPPASMLTEDAITKLRVKAEESKTEDERVVSLLEARRTGEEAIRRAETRLENFHKNKATLLNPDGVKTRIAEVGQALQSDDADRIREATRLLNSSLQQGFEFGSVFDDLFAKTPTSFSRPVTTTARTSTGKRQPAKSKRTEVATATTLGKNLGKIFGGGEFTLDPNLCFVLMPFEETFQPIFNDHIKPIVEAAGLTCLRADDIRGTTLITRDIWEKINRSRFIIADLSGQNPNVFYEVGLAHAIGKDVVLLTQTMTDVPFDLKALRCLVYSYTPPGMKKMESTLKATIEAVMKTG